MSDGEPDYYLEDDWDSDDEFGPAKDAQDGNSATSKNARVVVLKHMFNPKQSEEDLTLILELKEDVRKECSWLGAVTNVVLYDVSEFVILVACHAGAE